jgi:predicted homoserine dehydrogenase-like protein
VVYDPSTDAGKVRLLISDVDDASPVFTDDEIAAFLTIHGDVMLAAALALETVAANETLLLKYIRSRGLELDGTAVGRELRQQARQWRDTAGTADGDVTFMVAAQPDGWDIL